MQQALPGLSDDELTEQITKSNKYIRGLKDGGKDVEGVRKKLCQSFIQDSIE